MMTYKFGTDNEMTLELTHEFPQTDSQKYLEKVNQLIEMLLNNDLK